MKTWLVIESKLTILFFETKGMSMEYTFEYALRKYTPLVLLKSISKFQPVGNI